MEVSCYFVANTWLAKDILTFYEPPPPGEDAVKNGC